MMLAKPLTVRDKKYLVWMRTQPCTICKIESYYMNTHHTETGGMGIKGGDDKCIPLCTDCHRDLHQKTGKRGRWNDEELERIFSNLRGKYEKYTAEKNT